MPGYSPAFALYVNKSKDGEGQREKAGHGGSAVHEPDVKGKTKSLEIDRENLTITTALKDGLSRFRETQ